MLLCKKYRKNVSGEHIWRALGWFSKIDEGEASIDSPQLSKMVASKSKASAGGMIEALSTGTARQ